MIGRKLVVALISACAIATAAWAYRQRETPVFPGDVGRFEAGVVGYSSSPTALYALMADKKYRFVPDDGAISVAGSGTLVAITPVNIDPSKTYKVTFRVRVVKDDPIIKGSNIFAGVATYNGLGQLETERPGAHRYAALSTGVISAKRGWITLEGKITGTGNETPNQFRKTTKQARPVIMVNYRSDEAVTEVSSMTLVEVKP